MNHQADEWLLKATKWGLFRRQGTIDFSDLNLCKRFITWFNHPEVEYIFVDSEWYEDKPGRAKYSRSYNMECTIHL